MNKYIYTIGFIFATGVFITIILCFILTSINGIYTGNYKIFINTNNFNEHWFEFPLLIMGFIFFIITSRFKIKKQC